MVSLSISVYDLTDLCFKYLQLSHIIIERYVSFVYGKSSQVHALDGVFASCLDKMVLATTLAYN